MSEENLLSVSQSLSRGLNSLLLLARVKNDHNPQKWGWNTSASPPTGKNRFSCPGVHAGKTQGGQFTSLLQEALDISALASLYLKVSGKPHEWGSRINVTSSTQA